MYTWTIKDRHFWLLSSIDQPPVTFIKIGPLYDHLVYTRIVERLLLFICYCRTSSMRRSRARARSYTMLGPTYWVTVLVIHVLYVCARLCLYASGVVCSYLILEKRKLWQHNDFSIIVVLQSLPLGPWLDVECYNGAPYRIGGILLPSESRIRRTANTIVFFL